ncbi:MAG TPA: hypothetical protein VL053_11220 [Arachidicoccus sp.]|nr:hypothetical protein [Arachidicoccus sp.]
MINAENQIIEALTGSPELAMTKQEDWLAMLEEFPAFGIGHYLLAKKYSGVHSQDSTKWRQTAANHFSDIRWLDYLLQQEGSPSSIKAVESLQPLAAVPVTRPGTELPAQFAESDQTLQDTNKTLSTEETPLTPLVTAAAQPESLPSSSVLAKKGEVDEVPVENQRISSLISAQLADFQKPISSDAKLAVDKDPLYRTDYFASQGISYTKNQDELGKKVKKFTDWLKEMKQNSPTVPQLHTTPQEEQQVIRKAEDSLKNETILTESMADVLLQQGKMIQAREIYQKLSLLYPEKTSYFASKIDSLH